MRAICCVLTLCLFSGCGGGGSDLDRQNVEPSRSTGATIEKLMIQIGDQLLFDANPAEFENVSVEVSGESFSLAKSKLNVALIWTGTGTELACSLGELDTVSDSSGELRLEQDLAFLNESFQLECFESSAAVLAKTINVSARDDSLSSVLDEFLASYRNYPLNNFNAEEADLPRINFYYEINKILTAADIYQNPSRIGLNRQDPAIALLERYLINVAETFFQPCVGYDFENGELSQCRSEFMLDGYYLWRSPLNDTEGYRDKHAKIEWRAAAAVASAVRAIMIVNGLSDGCLFSDTPSLIREQSLSCRALNIRQLLHHHIWLKWSDEDFVLRTLGLNYLSVIQTTNVVHYLAWLEIFLEAMKQTSENQGASQCFSDCLPAEFLDISVRDRIFEFIDTNGSEVSISCRPKNEKNPSCGWRGYNLADSGSNDLSHLALLMYLFSSYADSGREFCTTDLSQCLDMQALIDTIRDVTWAGSLSDAVGAVNFPKFDIFLNGYCRKNYGDGSHSLWGYCNDYWVTEVSYNGSHMELFGFVHLAKFDRGLAIKMLEAADVDKDGRVSLADRLVKWYFGALYESLREPKELAVRG